jgi:hypothetical protein
MIWGLALEPRNNEIFTGLLEGALDTMAKDGSVQPGVGLSGVSIVRYVGVGVENEKRRPRGGDWTG